MKRSLLLGLLSTLAFAGALRAASDYLLEIDGIKGESADATHKDAIDIDAFSWGLSNSSTMVGGGSGVGKVSLQDFHFTTSLSKASPQIMAQCATGKHIPKAVLYARKPGGDARTDYYKVTLTDVLISSYSQSGAVGAGRPSDSVSIAFTSIKIEYTDDAGGVTSGTASLATAVQ